VRTLALRRTLSSRRGAAFTSTRLPVRRVPRDHYKACRAHDRDHPCCCVVVGELVNRGWGWGWGGYELLCALYTHAIVSRLAINVTSTRLPVHLVPTFLLPVTNELVEDAILRS